MAQPGSPRRVGFDHDVSCQSQRRSHKSKPADTLIRENAMYSVWQAWFSLYVLISSTFLKHTGIAVSNTGVERYEPEGEGLIPSPS